MFKSFSSIKLVFIKVFHLNWISDSQKHWRIENSWIFAHYYLFIYKLIAISCKACFFLLGFPFLLLLLLILYLNIWKRTWFWYLQRWSQVIVPTNFTFYRKALWFWRCEALKGKSKSCSCSFDINFSSVAPFWLHDLILWYI